VGSPTGSVIEMHFDARESLGGLPAVVTNEVDVFTDIIFDWHIHCNGFCANNVSLGGVESVRRFVLFTVSVVRAVQDVKRQPAGSAPPITIRTLSFGLVVRVGAPVAH